MGGAFPEASAILDAAAAGDPVAKAKVGAFMAGFADLLTMLTQPIDPERVVIAGPLARLGDRLLVPLRAALSRQRTLSYDPVIVASSLGEDAVVYGALGEALFHQLCATFETEAPLLPPLRPLPGDAGAQVPGGSTP